MKKILFTDLIGTLINHTSTQFRYNSYEKEIEIAGRKLNEYLKDGNYLVIVTNIGDHDPFKTMIDILIADLNNSIDKKYHSQITYFTQGNHQIRANDGIEKITIDNINYYIGKRGITTIEVKEKVDAIDIFLNKIKLPYEIHGLGDTIDDIPMLIKILQLGGQIALIAQNYYNYPQPEVKDIIHNQISLEFALEERNLMNLYSDLSKSTSENILNKNNLFHQKMIELEKIQKERIINLWHQFYNKELDLDRLNKNYWIFEILQGYLAINEDERKKKNNIFQTILPIIEQINLEASFTNYYTKVLKKSK